MSFDPVVWLWTASQEIKVLVQARVLQVMVGARLHLHPLLQHLHSTHGDRCEGEGLGKVLRE